MSVGVGVFCPLSKDVEGSQEFWLTDTLAAFTIFCYWLFGFHCLLSNLDFEIFQLTF